MNGVAKSMNFESTGLGKSPGKIFKFER